MIGASDMVNRSPVPEFGVKLTVAPPDAMGPFESPAMKSSVVPREAKLVPPELGVAPEAQLIAQQFAATAVRVVEFPVELKLVASAEFVCEAALYENVCILIGCPVIVRVAVMVYAVFAAAPTRA